METFTTVAFVRHGKVHNPSNVYYGRSPRIKLSKQGQAEAHSAADALRTEPISAVFSSPALRARQTAQIIASSHMAKAVHIIRRLHDVYTPYDGCPISKVISRNWNVYTGSDHEYEQPFDVMKRTLHLIEMVHRRYSGQYIVAVTHFDVILYMMFRALDKSLDTATVAEYKRTYPYITHGSISKFVYRTKEIDEVPCHQYVDHTATTLR
jgi:broad specificity phosphatase PhoE